MFLLSLVAFCLNLYIFKQNADWGVTSTAHLRTEIQILSLHWKMKNIRLF